MKNLKEKFAALVLATLSLVSCSSDDNSATPNPQGLSFSETTISGIHFSERRWHRTTVFNNKLWLIGGELTGGHDNEVWSTSNGVNWTKELTSGHTQFLNVAGGALLTFNNKMWLIGGFQSGLDSRNEIWNSTDGINWTEVTTSTVFSARHFFGATVFNNKMWVIGGTSGSSTVGMNDVWSSTDGVNWTQHTINGVSFSARLHHKLISYNNKLYLIGGYSDGTNRSDVWSTTDGNTWVKETDGGSTIFPAKYSFETVVKDNAIYVIGGQTESGLTDDIYKSTNGSEWTKLNVNNTYGARRDFQAILFNNKLTIIGGSSGSYENDIWTLN